MIYNMKNVFRIAAIVCASAWLSSCSTYVNPFSSLYWKGKNIKEFIEDKELAVNETKICKEKEGWKKQPSFSVFLKTEYFFQLGFDFIHIHKLI